MEYKEKNILRVRVPQSNSRGGKKAWVELLKQKVVDRAERAWYKRKHECNSLTSLLTTKGKDGKKNPEINTCQLLCEGIDYMKQ